MAGKNLNLLNYSYLTGSKKHYKKNDSQVEELKKNF